MKLVIVTATLDPRRSSSYWKTWRKHAELDLGVVVALTGREESWADTNVGEVAGLDGLVQDGDVVLRCKGFGVVPFFSKATQVAVSYMGADLVACLHDDLAILQPGWDRVVVDWFKHREDCVLLGFGGATGLGASEIYKEPYDPMQLARQNFCSNMKGAEAHGRRNLWPTQVACLDGFSLIGRGKFMWETWEKIQEAGIIHHAYDSYFGVLAAKAEKEVWMLPVPCDHHGGLSAVGHPGYAAWAKNEKEEGDATIWKESHSVLYEAGRGILPIRV